jgi:membrane-bound PQQ-dependent dehydrogenase (glucose/quinate/shikimate family)
MVWALIVILAVVGLPLVAGGAILITLGGSPYYVAAGLAALASAVALVRRSRAAVVIYASLLMATLLWSLWEVGLDGWALAPRLLGPGIVGLLFLTPPIRRRSGAAGSWWITGPVLAIAAAICLTAGLAVYPDYLPQPKTAFASMPPGPTEWRNWGNTIGGTRYAPVSQINTGNVDRLEVAWTYDSHRPLQAVPSFEATPLAADGRLYICLQPGIVAAVDEDTGREIWRQTTPGFEKLDFAPLFGGKCRGVSYYEAPRPVADCPKRVLFTTGDGHLMAVDAATGQRCRSFGQDGVVDLGLGMGNLRSSTGGILAAPSSPPAIVNGVAVIGQSVSDLGSLDAPPGVIRGYDVVNGVMRWAWDAGRPDQTLLQPGELYTADTPNAWGVLSGDEQLGLVFVPTGNSLPDYFGGMRWRFAEPVSSAIVAIDVATGKVRWSFQTVHHDLWDYDVGAQPVAVDLAGPDGVTPALLVATKLGQIFVLDRRTGQPIDPVVEEPVPQGGVPGEWTSPTQPFTTGFPSFAGPKLREQDMWGLTPLDELWCRIRFKKARYEGPFTPTESTRNTLFFPGTAGGIDWGSVSVDTERGLVAVNALRFANFGRLLPRQEAPAVAGGGGGIATFPMAGTPYVFQQTLFMSPLHVPCMPPPYGSIAVLNLNTRKLLWSKSLGTAAGSGPFNIPSRLPIRMGVPNMGGSIVTAGGLVFIAAAQDRMLRAYDIGSGRELWRAQLPAVAAATPMSYVSSTTGRQYVVVAAGGHYGIPGPPIAGSVIAFALPRRQTDGAGSIGNP